MADYKDNLLGEANSFLEVLEQVSRLAPLDKPVLVIGERGTGKELIASRLHFLSSRWQGPVISLNCAALNENLLDSELFGHEAGAFTGASKRHPGRFERADGGTLFLDELATAPMLVQEKLLRVIEYGELERVGGSQPLQVNGRLVCATNADLPQMVEDGLFRADLLDRLAFDVVQLPPLRERPEDIPLLANHLLRQSADRHKPFVRAFSTDAMQRLMAAVEQRFPRVQAGDFKIPLKNIPTGGENQRMGPDLFPNRAFVNQVGDAGCRRFLVVLHRQIIALSLDDGVDKRAHRRQPLRVRHVKHDGVAQGIQLLFHCRAQRNVRPQRIQINRRL